MTAEFKSNIGCNRETDNSYFSCPIKGDYRLFTDWRPRCALQYANVINNKLPSSLDQRMYLTNNATELMKKNAQNAYIKSSCGPCVDNPDWNTGTQLPEFDEQVCNARTCSYNVTNAFGLGRSRKYFDDETYQQMHKEFITEKEKENSFFKRNANLCATNEENLQYYPLDGVIQSEYNRYSVPGGAKLMSGGDSLINN